MSKKIKNIIKAPPRPYTLYDFLVSKNINITNEIFNFHVGDLICRKDKNGFYQIFSFNISQKNERPNIKDVYVLATYYYYNDGFPLPPSCIKRFISIHLLNCIEAKEILEKRQEEYKNIYPIKYPFLYSKLLRRKYHNYYNQKFYDHN